jgi:GTP-binding protein HflX
MVGDQKGVSIPDLSRYRAGIPRLRGLRLIHTHLQGEPLTQDDLTDLALLRLDMMVAITANDGEPGLVYSAHLLPDNSEKKVWRSSHLLLSDRETSTSLNGFNPSKMNFKEDRDRSL